MVKLSIRIFESVCTYHRYQYGQTFTVIKIENTISSPRMLMQSKVSMHVETCCLLVRECANDDEMVSIKVDLEGISLDQGKFEPDEKPTYGNIKKWIKEKYGFNVTNLYIGQIKDKVGMEKRKNYNIGSGEGRVPTCPQEKEEAIIEAFKHFNLI